MISISCNFLYKLRVQSWAPIISSRYTPKLCRHILGAFQRFRNYIFPKYQAIYISRNLYFISQAVEINFEKFIIADTTDGAIFCVPYNRLNLLKSKIKSWRNK